MDDSSATWQAFTRAWTSANNGWSSFASEYSKASESVGKVKAVLEKLSDGNHTRDFTLLTDLITDHGLVGLCSHVSNINIDFSLAAQWASATSNWASVTYDWSSFDLECSPVPKSVKKAQAVIGKPFHANYRDDFAVITGLITGHGLAGLRPHVADKTVIAPLLDKYSKCLSKSGRKGFEKLIKHAIGNDLNYSYLIAFRIVLPIRHCSSVLFEILVAGYQPEFDLASDLKFYSRLVGDPNLDFRGLDLSHIVRLDGWLTNCS